MIDFRVKLYSLDYLATMYFLYYISDCSNTNLFWAIVYGYSVCLLFDTYLHRFVTHKQYCMTPQTTTILSILSFLLVPLNERKFKKSHRAHHSHCGDPKDFETFSSWNLFNGLQVAFDAALTTEGEEKQSIITSQLVKVPMFIAQFLLLAYYGRWQIMVIGYLYFGMAVSFGHLYGHGPDEKDDCNALDSDFFSLANCGFSYHFTHHIYPQKLILGKYDLTGTLIHKFLEVPKVKKQQ